MVEGSGHVNIHGDPCKSRVYDPGHYDGPDQYAYNSSLLANSDFTEISYIHTGSGAMDKFVRLHAIDSNITSLEYLALGDSYSSGEGDLGEYYLLGTGGRDECHLSTRSYPFLLREKWGLNWPDMNSVACSGARVIHDYISRIEIYDGQTNQISGKSEAHKLAKREQSLSMFIPGIVPQIEFVKKYRPKVVTLTGAGNDVGFADVLKRCVSIGWSEELFGGTCSFAKAGGAREALIDSIHNQYGVTRLLISKIREASPHTKIYIIGYPKFISSETATCGLNPGVINSMERAMVNNMVSEMNNVLWRAADDSGAMFIDIEDSLDGGQLCQGSGYITGVLDIGAHKRNIDYFQEVFHPNAAGHAKIAQTIFGSVRSLSHTPYPSYRPGAKTGDYYQDSPISRQRRIAQGSFPVGSIIKIVTDPFTFMSKSTVDLMIYSEPVSLGQVEVDGDGGFKVDIELPESVSVGYHTLVVKGVSPSGEPVTLYQFVTVTSGIEGDMDGDGISDSKDVCNFIAEWYDEQTSKNVCELEDVDRAVGVIDIAKSYVIGSEGAEYRLSGSSLSRGAKEYNEFTSDDSRFRFRSVFDSGSTDNLDVMPNAVSQSDKYPNIASDESAKSRFETVAMVTSSTVFFILIIMLIARKRYVK